jgi:RNA-binding protein
VLTSRQRSYLSSLANDIDPVVSIGKGGPTESVLAALEGSLEAHELVKLRLIAFKEDRADIASEFAEASSAELVRTIGNVAVLYKAAKDSGKRMISLP